MNRIDFSLALVLFVIALIVRLSLTAGFDGLYGQDAYAYYDFAGDLGESIRTGESPPAFFWSLGYPALLLSGFTLGGETPFVAQAISIIMGAGLASLVYLLARLLNTSQFAAFITGALMAICGQAVQSSVVIMADIPALFWTTLSAVMLLHWRQNDDRFRWLLLAAVLLTFAMLTRWIYGVLAPLWAILVLFHWRGRIHFARSTIIVLTVALIFLPQIAFSLTNPYPTLNHAWVQGWSFANAFERNFVNVDGQFHYEQINTLYYAQVFYQAHYLAPIFTPLLVLGVFRLIYQRRITDFLMLAGWGLLPYLFLIGIPYQNIRFPLIVMPAVFVLVGFGLDQVSAIGRKFVSMQIQNLERGWGEVLSTLLITLIVLSGILTMHTRTRALVGTFIANQQRDKDAAAWVNTMIPSDAHLYTFGLTLTLQHYTPFEIYEIYYESPQTLAERWQVGRDDYLLINVWQIENQWAGREPQIVYDWLQNERGLTRMERFGNYTLFRVAG